jgi:hypothetical protein
VLVASGQAFWSKKYTLAPLETKAIDIGELIENQVKDDSGYVLPRSLQSGQANWYLARQFGGTGRLLQSNPRTYSARSFSCGIYSMIMGGVWEPYTTSLAVGQTADLGWFFAEVGLTESGDNYGYCFGSYVGTSTSFYYYWETLSPSIASISGPNDESYVNAQGVSPGNATIFGEVWDQYGCGWDQYVGETVTADQTPVITGISPSVWPAGTTTSVTFTGQYFGTNAPTLTFSDPTITYTLSSYNDQTIIANITVAAGTQTESVSVSVTNNGYGGLGFYGRGSGGQSAQSTPATATVQGAPSISGISPGQGLVGTGISVTITGTGFAAGSTVNAGSNISVSNVSVVSSTQITATFTPSNSTSAGGNQGVTVTVSGQPSNSQNFFVQYPLHIAYVTTSSTPNNGQNTTVSGTDISIVRLGVGTIATNACGGYHWMTYETEDQSGNAIVNGTVIWSESFSNLSPSTPPWRGVTTPGAPFPADLSNTVLADTYWINGSTGCPAINSNLTFNQTWTPNVGGTISGGAITGGVNYPLTTIISTSESTNSQGLPSFSTSITTP